MIMTNENVREFPQDIVLKHTLLHIIPKRVTPNMVTVFRAFLIPFNLYYVWRGEWDIVIALFLFTAGTDIVDGSMARARKQITKWGTVADPLVDKIFIGSVVALFVAKEIHPAFAVVILTLECLIGLSNYIRYRKGQIVSANKFGKTKMILQVIGVTLLFISRSYGFEIEHFSVGVLSLSIVFAIISLYTYSM